MGRTSRPLFLYRPTQADAWIHNTIDAARDAFTGLGHDCMTIADLNDEAGKELQRLTLAGAPLALIDISNRLGLPPNRPNARKFSIMVDHPFVRSGDVLNGRPGDKMGFCDQTHLVAAQALRDDIGFSFLPHGGPKPESDPVPMRDRKIPVLFGGYLKVPQTKAAWQESRPTIPPWIAGIVFESAERLLAEPMPVLDALEQSCARISIDAFTQFEPEILFRIVETIEELAETISRFHMLEAFRKIPLHLVAPPLPPEFAPLAENWVQLGTASSEQFRRVVANSKIVLNPTVKFAFGAHDRVFLAQSQGALSATRASAYLAQFYKDRESIIFFDREPVPAGSVEWIKDNLDDDRKLQDMADRASVIFAKNHSWESRARQIEESLEL